MSKITAWDRVLLARKADRPKACEYINEIFEDFIELHGDRCYGDDKAIIGGILSWNRQLWNAQSVTSPPQGPRQRVQKHVFTVGSAWRPIAASAPTARNRSTAMTLRKHTTRRRLRSPQSGNWQASLQMRASPEPA